MIFLFTYFINLILSLLLTDFLIITIILNLKEKTVLSLISFINL